MRCCVIPCCQTDAGSSQKHFLPFRVLLNVGIDPNVTQKKFFFSFLALFKEKFGIPTKTFLVGGSTLGLPVYFSANVRHVQWAIPQICSEGPMFIPLHFHFSSITLEAK